MIFSPRASNEPYKSFPVFFYLRKCRALILILIMSMVSNFQAKFFMTYVLSSGWASLACELMQIYPLLCNYFRRFILLKDGYNDTLTFPYHTEIPRVLLFGFVGFTCSILVPLILPFLLVYFVLAYLIYRNQVRALLINAF